MRKLRTKSDVTRAQIIQGALQALEKTGVIGTTTRSIATEANVQLATLHYHFESKSTLLVAVLEALIDEIADCGKIAPAPNLISTIASSFSFTAPGDPSCGRALARLCSTS
jgi:AcrR family transcriptional regulator